MTLRFLVTLIFLSCLFLAGCGAPKKETAAKPEPAPDTYRVNFQTSRGDFVIEVTKAWAPEGAERFYRLVRSGFYDDARFFRVVRGFVVQFGIAGDPAVSRRWRNMVMADDPVKQSNKRGFVSFAAAGPNTRTTQVFINLADNTRLDKMGFAPFGQVVSGMLIVDRLYSSYGEMAPRGAGPNPEMIELQGNAYLERQFPRLDYIMRASVARAEHGSAAE